MDGKHTRLCLQHKWQADIIRIGIDGINGGVPPVRVAYGASRKARPFHFINIH